MLEERALDVVGDVETGQLGELIVDEADLAEHHDAVGDAEQFQDRQVLGRLRLPAFGCRHYEQGGIHRPHTGQHVLHESDVPGHVHEADLPARRQRAEREAEVDGEPALLLLGQPVRVGAGEGAHQRRLAVVHVTCGADDVHAASLPRPGRQCRTARPSPRQQNRLVYPAGAAVRSLVELDGIEPSEARFQVGSPHQR